YGLNKSSDLISQWRGAIGLENNKPYNPWIVQNNSDKSETSIGVTAINKHINYQDIIAKLVALPQSPNIENVINNVKQLASQGKQEYLGLIDATFITINKPSSTVPEWRYVTNAILLPGYWLLLKPIEYNNESVLNLPSIVTIQTSIQQKALEEYIRDPNGVSFYELCDKITMAKTFGYKPYPLQMILHKLIALPILDVAMVLIAAVVSIRFARFNNIKLYMLGGLIAGFCLYLITILSQDFGKLGIVPPIIAAWTPVVIALFTGVSFILRREDG
ncbi:MAG: LptF/LptG family permease, partial [Alphaproteobacteria bacterium]|nr:LptF/LptG family permease [Alphaproteobacteria bacterium]